VSYPALLVDVAIFVLSLWVGFEVISKVPATLHTPLMSAANSIHGIVLAGAMLIAVTAHDAVGYVIAFLAAAFAAMNVVGGYVVTGRMLKMFRRRPAVQAGAAVPAGAGPDAITAASNGPAANRNGTGAKGTAPGSAAAAANGSSRTGQTA
jgi:H+-translocating NAD(P) transhydrogenase subunit alpha